MMRLSVILVAAGLGLGVPGLASAQSFTGAEEIMRGDLAGAEREIQAERTLFPEHTDLLINLATVYARTQRVEQARALYRVVLAQPDEDLTVPNGGFVSAHAVADAALQRLASTQTIALR